MTHYHYTTKTAIRILENFAIIMFYLFGLVQLFTWFFKGTIPLFDGFCVLFFYLICGMWLSLQKSAEMSEIIDIQNNNTIKPNSMERMNYDEQAEKYLDGLVEKKECFNHGDMETCFVTGCQVASELQEGCTGTFGQAIGSLKHGFLVARQGWNGKGMFLFMRPADSLSDAFVIETMKSAPYNYKEWLKHHPSEEGGVLFREYICMKAADGSVVNGWLSSQTDMLSEDWVLVNPEE